MRLQDGEQYNIPGQPDKSNPHPNLPSDEEKDSILSGAKNEDQLEKLKPKDEDDKAPGEIGAPPFTQTDKGE